MLPGIIIVRTIVNFKLELDLLVFFGIGKSNPIVDAMVTSDTMLAFDNTTIILRAGFHTCL